MTLPDDVAAALDQEVVVGALSQAFPFLTVDHEGYPHVALLSTREVRREGASLLVVVRGKMTRLNLERSCQATFVAVEGTTCHSVKLQVRTSLERADALGVVLDPTTSKADSIGLPLNPLGFVAVEALAELERWEATAQLLDALADAARHG